MFVFTAAPKPPTFPHKVSPSGETVAFSVWTDLCNFIFPLHNKIHLANKTHYWHFSASSSITWNEKYLSFALETFQECTLKLGELSHHLLVTQYFSVFLLLKSPWRQFILSFTNFLFLSDWILLANYTIKDHQSDCYLCLANASTRATVDTILTNVSQFEPIDQVYLHTSQSVDKFLLILVVLNLICLCS